MQTGQSRTCLTWDNPSQSLAVVIRLHEPVFVIHLCYGFSEGCDRTVVRKPPVGRSTIHVAIMYSKIISGAFLRPITARNLACSRGGAKIGKLGRITLLRQLKASSEILRVHQRRQKRTRSLRRFISSFFSVQFNYGSNSVVEMW